LALGLVWAVCRLAPRIPAAGRCWLWRLAYLKLLVALLWLPTLDLPLLPPTDPAPAANFLAVSQGLTAPPAVAPESVTIAVVPDSLVTAAPAAEVASAVAPTVAGWLLLLWIACLLRQGGRAIRQSLTVRRLRLSGKPLNGGQLDFWNLALSRDLGLTHVPQLLSSTATYTPLLIGMIRPCIVLPESLLSTCTADELRLVLAHELAHVQRRDLLWGWLPLLARFVCGFHPLVLLAEREIGMAQEIACDETALHLTGAASAAYGSLLVRVAARFTSRPSQGFGMIGMTESYHTLKRRLSAMKSFPSAPRRYRVAIRFSLLTLGLAALLPWRVSAQTTPPPVAVPPVPTPPATTPLGGVPPVPAPPATTPPVALPAVPATPATDVLPPTPTSPVLPGAAPQALPPRAPEVLQPVAPRALPPRGKTPPPTAPAALPLVPAVPPTATPAVVPEAPAGGGPPTAIVPAPPAFISVQPPSALRGRGVLRTTPVPATPAVPGVRSRNTPADAAPIAAPQGYPMAAPGMISPPKPATPARASKRSNRSSENAAPMAREPKSPPRPAIRLKVDPTVTPEIRIDPRIQVDPTIHLAPTPSLADPRADRPRQNRGRSANDPLALPAKPEIADPTVVLPTPSADPLAAPDEPKALPGGSAPRPTTAPRGRSAQPRQTPKGSPSDPTALPPTPVPPAPEVKGTPESRNVPFLSDLPIIGQLFRTAPTRVPITAPPVQKGVTPPAPSHAIPFLSDLPIVGRLFRTTPSK